MHIYKYKYGVIDIYLLTYDRGVARIHSRIFPRVPRLLRVNILAGKPSC